MGEMSSDMKKAEEAFMHPKRYKNDREAELERIEQ